MSIKIIPNMMPEHLLARVINKDPTLKAFGIILCSIDNSYRCLNFLKKLKRAIYENENIVLARILILDNNMELQEEALQIELISDVHLYTAPEQIKHNVHIAKLAILELSGLNQLTREIKTYIEILLSTKWQFIK